MFPRGHEERPMYGARKLGLFAEGPTQDRYTRREVQKILGQGYIPLELEMARIGWEYPKDVVDKVAEERKMRKKRKVTIGASKSKIKHQSYSFTLPEEERSELADPETRPQVIAQPSAIKTYEADKVAKLLKISKGQVPAMARKFGIGVPEPGKYDQEDVDEARKKLRKS